MKNTERTIIYAGLALSLTMGLAAFSTGSSAIAESAPSKQADAPRIASIDVLSVVERMVSSDKYKTPRMTNETEQADKLKPLADELNKIQTEAKDLKEDSQRFKDMSTQFVQKNQDFQRLRQEAANQVENYNTLQVAEAYRLVLDAANQLATTSGYTHVIASKSGPATIASTNIPGAVQEMLARPLIKGVAADDLTERLIKQLGLENVVVNPPAATPIPTPAPATPPGQ